MRKRIAAELGLATRPIRTRRTTCWTDERITVALDEFLEDRDSWPSRREFDAAGLGGLLQNITASGRRESWARQYGLVPRAVARSASA
jgi:hypothetical protein